MSTYLPGQPTSLSLSSLLPTPSLLLLEKRPFLFFSFSFVAAGQLEVVQLLAPSVVVKDKAVNFTTVLRPSSVGTVTYYWWFDNRTEASHRKASNSAAARSSSLM